MVLHTKEFKGGKKKKKKEDETYHLVNQTQH